jgi:hypothetical protein
MSTTKKLTVAVRVYLTPLKPTEFLSRKQEKFFTRHGLAIIKNKGKNLTRYALSGNEQINSKGDIFFTAAGFITHPPSYWHEEDRCLEIEEDSLLKLHNERILPSKDEMLNGYKMSAVVQMQYNPETGKLRFPPHAMAAA